MGGAAEFKPPVAAARERKTPLLVKVERHMDCSLQRFAVVARTVQESGQRTGQLGQVELLLNHAKRELAGRLTDDAERTLTAFDQQVAVLGLVVHAEPPDPGNCSA